jgi:hypothetical protein
VDQLKIRVIDGEPCLLIPLRLIQRREAPVADEDDLITDVVRVLLETDPLRQGRSPTALLAALDVRGKAYYADAGKRRLPLFTSRLWREHEYGIRLERIRRGRYAACFTVVNWDNIPKGITMTHGSFPMTHRVRQIGPLVAASVMTLTTWVMVAWHFVHHANIVV